MALLEWPLVQHFDESERPAEPDLLLRPDELAPGVNQLWVNAREALGHCLSRIVNELPSRAGLPVLKASYLANSCPTLLSFAGIGATAVCAGADLSSLGDGLSAILRARYRGAPVYYRNAHPSARNIDLSVLALERMEKQRIWGVIWGSGEGWVCHCSLEERAPYTYVTVHSSLARSNPDLPAWLRGRAFDQLMHIVSAWTATGRAGSHFDVEFCISADDQLSLTQWRPIPERSAGALDMYLGGGAVRAAPSPFGLERNFEGRVVTARSLPTDLASLRNRLHDAKDEVWILPYLDGEVTLFTVMAVIQSTVASAAPHLAVVHHRNSPLRHLHAIAVEAPRIDSLVHLWEGDAEFRDGDDVRFDPSTGMTKKNPRTVTASGTASRITVRALVKAPALRRGDRVGVFSPSAPSGAAHPLRLSRAIRAFERRHGVEVVTGTLAHSHSGYTSGSGQARAKELTDLFSDSSVKGVIAAIGGLNSNSVLEFVDYDVVRAFPKVVIGYSDCDAILLALHAVTGLVTFHGPSLLPQFGEHPTPIEYTSQALEAAVFTDRPLGQLQPARVSTHERNEWHDSEPSERMLSEVAGWAGWRNGVAHGPLFCANIETVNALVGTPYLPSLTGCVVALEATGVEAYLPRFERALTHLRLSGVLSQIAGLVVARCPDAQPINHRTLRDVVLDTLGELPGPVAADVDFGHTDPMLTLPLGCRCRLRVDGDEVDFSVLESGVLP